MFDRTADSYLVQPGDTLYSIAWRFGLDHKALARANGIAPPYTIYRGQRLRLREAPAAPAPSRKEPAPRPPATTAGGGRPAERPTAAAAALAWRAPTDAPVRRPFGKGNKGIDYALGSGRPVRAAASGEVVYAGSGLGGFRHLVIVKHDPQYLSAYSFDRPLAVREGQRVKVGDSLADTEEGARLGGILHFEIRRNGDPVDPNPLIGR
ncbi:MAG TPA: peptidoglycan DD-metalloendopeptidase family protein [Pseudomonadales bacterium]